MRCSEETRKKISETHKAKGIRPIKRFDATGVKRKPITGQRISQALSKKVSLECVICKKVFKVSPSRLCARFCSIPCMNIGLVKPMLHKQTVRRHSQMLCQERRRARQKLLSIIDFTGEQWEALKRKYNFMCLCCKQQEPFIKLTIDHVIPISFGGNHTLSNVQPLCRSCNSIKMTSSTDFRVSDLTLTPPQGSSP